MTRPTPIARAAVCALATFAPFYATAQAPDAWQFQATIYGYLPDIGGRTSFPPGSGGSNVQLDIDTILDKLHMAFMGSLEARKGRWGMFTDVIYMNLGEAKSGSRDLVIGGGLPAGVTANVDYDLKGWVWTLAGTYRAVATPRYSLDLLAGARQPAAFGIAAQISSQEVYVEVIVITSTRFHTRIFVHEIIQMPELVGERRRI